MNNNEEYQLKKPSKFSHKFKKESITHSKKYIIYLGIISVIIIHILLFKAIRLKSKLKSLKSSIKQYRKTNIKNSLSQTHLEDILSNYIDSRFAKESKNEEVYFKNEENLKLFIENRTQYFINGRKRVLEYVGRDYNDSNIVTIQDKYNWLSIHESPEYKSKIVDKILLHEYSKKILGKDICVPILKIYNNTNEINLDELPDKFIIKCNHGSSMNIICNNRSNFNLAEAKKDLNKWIKMNYGLHSSEFQYIYVNKKIFVEKYLCDDIIDYKIYCYNGKPMLIRLAKQLHDMEGKVHNYYYTNWTLSDIESNFDKYYRRPDMHFDKPNNLDLMLDYATKLSQEFVFVGIDFYDVHNTIYLGEISFTPINAKQPYKNREQSLYLGSLLNLSRIKKSFYNE